MNIFTYTRQYQSDAGALGPFPVYGKTFYLAGLPSTVAVPGESQIPQGQYLCEWAFSPKFNQNVYHIRGVADNPNDEIHMGNFAGDTSKINTITGKPYLSSVIGCLVIGLSMGIIEGQDAVTNSDEAFAQFNTLMNGESFMLNIVDDYQD